MTYGVAEKYRVYVTDPSRVPEGVQLEQGPRGGKYYDSSSRPRARLKKPTATKKPKAPKAPKAPKERPKPKRAIGQPFTGGEDPNLPKSIQQESPAIRDGWLKAFNETLEKGGSEADALRAARETLPKKPKQPPKVSAKPPKREIGMPYTDADDANLPTNVKRESDAIRKRWVTTFNNVLNDGGSEADAFAAANGGLPDRKKKKAMDDKEPGRAMICLYPEPNSARALALEGVSTIDHEGTDSQDVVVESPDRLHVTLAYFPRIEPEDRDAVLQEAARAAWYASPFLRSRVEGMAVFAADDDVVPYVALLDPRPLTDLRQQLEWCPWISKKHGFIPHITLAYVPSDSSLEIGPVDIDETLTFTHISVVFDDQERHDFRLGGGMVDHDIAYRTLGPEARKGADSAGLRSEIDSDEVTLDAVDSPLRLRVSRPSGEDMDDVATSDTQEKAGRRLAGSWRERLSGAISGLKELLSWAEYDDGEHEDEMEMKAEEGFYVFKDTSGADRWLSISSNGFKDREGEIVSTEALERAVAEADKSGDRGVLRLFHIPESDIGSCDFQGVQGRFLIESGTFYDSELARKAVEFFRSTDESLGTSIGFIYPVASLEDGVYKEITRIVERSVCPHWAAANPWTTFNVKEEGVMDSLKAGWLEQIAGPKLAQDILSRAERATKQLEETVAFKSASAVEALAEMRKAAEASGIPEVIKAYETLVSAVVGAPEQSSDKQSDDLPAPQEKAAEQPASEEKAGDDLPAAQLQETIAIDATGLADVLTPLLEPITKALNAVMAAHEATAKQVSELADWQKTIDATPRAGTAYRATSADGNVIDAEEAKKMLGEANPPANPVAPYIEDLLKGAPIS